MSNLLAATRGLKKNSTGDKKNSNGHGNNSPKFHAPTTKFSA